MIRPVIDRTAVLTDRTLPRGSAWRLPLTIGDGFSLTGKVIVATLQAKNDPARLAYVCRSDGDEMTVDGQTIAVYADPAAISEETDSTTTLADVSALGMCVYWLDIWDTDELEVLMRVQGALEFTSGPNAPLNPTGTASAVTVSISDATATTVTVTGTGADGASAFIYIAYASDDAGADFTLTPDVTSTYVAFLASDTEIATPVALDFAGLWVAISGASGTVTSVAVTGTDGIDVDSGSPITTSGTIALGVNAATLKTHLSLDAVENTALSTWAGSTNITTLGTISTGTVPAANVSGLGTAATTESSDYATSAQGALADSAIQPGDDAADLGSSAATDGYVLTADGAGGAAWEVAAGGGGSGTVTSVAVSGSDGIEVDSGSPVTSSGTIALGINASTLSAHLGLGTAATTDATAYAPALGADDNYVTDAEKTVIGNTSGTNTGDNAVNSLYSGLVTNATHTGDVTGATALTIADGVVTEAKCNSSINASLDLADSSIQPGNAALTDERVPTASGLTTKFGTSKATIVDGDKIAILDSAATDAPKHSLFSLIKSTLKTYFDTLYAAALGSDDNYVTDAEKAALHAAATVTGNGISLTGQQISLDIGTGATQVAAGNHGHSVTGILGVTIDGAGSAITTGIKGYLYVPYACTITVAELAADVSGSIVIDVWKDTAANFPPTDADSIAASAPPTLSSAQRSSDSTLTGWTVSLAAGDYLGFNVDSASTVTRVTLALKVTRTI